MGTTDGYSEQGDAATNGAAGGPAGNGGEGGRPVGRPGQVRLTRWRVLSVLVRGGALVAVFATGQLVMRNLLGDPGPGPDPDIGGAIMVLAAVVLTGALGALRDAWRYGFRRAAVDWAAAVGLLAAIGVADLVRGWLDDRAAGAGDVPVTLADLVAPLVAIGIVAGAAVTVAVLGAALGETVSSRRGVGPAGPRPAA